MTTADKLIARSVSHTEIATADWTSELGAALRAACRGCGEGNDGIEDYWGVTEDGHEWRVELRGAVTNEQIRRLREEARSAGDREQVDLCTRALGGDGEARDACAATINDATARE